MPAMNDRRRKIEIESKRNEFLDVYSFYLKTRISLIFEEARFRAYELRLLDPGFIEPF